ncbi:MAG: NAD(P)H-hydrate dehydratase [Firmicutes bacterium]|nr:NAD(P)H-hydrate dehydratase [Bacillota bacterium]
MIGLSNKGSRTIDKLMIEDFCLPGVVLMEEAALGIFSCLNDKYILENKLIYIFVGKGNNGGDGLALARILFNRNYRVKIILLFDEGFSSEATIHLNVAKKMGLEIEPFHKDLEKPDLIVDGILGTGFSGSLEGIVKSCVEWINNCTCIKVAIDIPTGINGDSGDGELYVEADLTIALGYLKTGHLISNKLKSVYLVKLEIASQLENRLAEEDKVQYLTALEAGKMIPKRELESHKGTFGKVGILGGQKEMLGAGLLAGKGALRAGCGLVTLWLESFEGILGQEPELMLENWSEFLNKEIDVLVIGPGLGRMKTIDLENILRSFKGNVLIDADGLFWLKQGWIKREWIRGEVVLTPHPKEMEMLLGVSLERSHSVIEAAKRYNCVAIIKGYRTSISDGKRLCVNLTGNPGMATAGSGDVLSGIIGSLMAQRLDVYDAVVLGTYLHGLSGDLAGNVIGLESLIASDLIDYLPKAISRVKKIIDEKQIVVKIY